MTNKWVGWTACLVLIAAAIGAGAQDAQQTEYDERFQGPDTPWIGASGDVEVTSTYGSQGRLIHFLRVSGDGSGDLPFARAHVDPAAVDTTRTGYELIALLERDPAYGSPDWIGITFGEDADGHYLAGFENDEIFIAEVNHTGAMSKIFVHGLTQEDWDRVPNIGAHRKEDGVDQRLRYTLQVAGSLITVKINGLALASTDLLSLASGHFGIAAADATSVHAQQVIYRVLDFEPPWVEIYRPQNGTFYLDDTAVPGLTTGGPAIVIGDITLGADVIDTTSGVDNARLYLNGEYLPGSRVTQTGMETTWTVDTSSLPFGYHEFTVQATDRNGNIGSDSVRFLVISDETGSGTTAAILEVLDHLLP